MAASVTRSAVAPVAPTMGNRLFASDAPAWTEIIEAPIAASDRVLELGDRLAKLVVPHEEPLSGAKTTYEVATAMSPF